MPKRRRSDVIAAPSAASKRQRYRRDAPETRQRRQARLNILSNFQCPFQDDSQCKYSESPESCQFYHEAESTALDTTLEAPTTSSGTTQFLNESPSNSVAAYETVTHSKPHFPPYICLYSLMDCCTSRQFNIVLPDNLNSSFDELSASPSLTTASRALVDAFKTVKTKIQQQFQKVVQLSSDWSSPKAVTQKGTRKSKRIINRAANNGTCSNKSTKRLALAEEEEESTEQPKVCRYGLHLKVEDLLDLQQFEAAHRQLIVAYGYKEEVENCCVCLEQVKEKKVPKNRAFGIQDNCSHVICVACLRRWRANVKRNCPVCRETSNRYVVSRIFVPEGTEKRALFANEANVIDEPMPSLLDIFNLTNLEDIFDIYPDLQPLLVLGRPRYTHLLQNVVFQLRERYDS